MSQQTTARSPVRVALVGCGEVCELKHLPALRRVRDAQVVAVVDTDHARAARVADRFGIAHRFADVEALLDARLADVIGVLVPPRDHVKVARLSLAAGCHVLVEKPLALSLDDADALIAAERTAAGSVVMGLHMRWHRLMRRARDTIRDGGIGAPESIRAVWSSPRDDAETPDWKKRRSTGGGALVEIAVHLFDLWRFLLETEVTEVFVETRHGRRHDERAVVTAALANGMLASASLSERSSHDLEINVAGGQGRLRLACQRFDGFEQYGLHETDGMLGPRLRKLTSSIRELPGAVARMRRLGEYGESFRAQWQHAVDVARGALPACTLEDGRAALRVVLAAAESASRHEPVRVDSASRTLMDVT
jgi:myo-inositol 2-dehydrogenase/D-chiro-inositol 1-dehydrogenase